MVASHDLAAGSVVTPADVTQAPVLTSGRPDGVVVDPSDAIGRRLVGAVRRGEALTDVRFIEADELAAAAGDGRVAVPVRISDGEVATLLTPGSVVDVVAADGHGAVQVVAEGATVISVPSTAGDSFDGALVVMSMQPDEATMVVGAAAMGSLAVTLRG